MPKNKTNYGDLIMAKKSKKSKNLTYVHGDGETVFSNTATGDVLTVAWGAYSPEIKHKLFLYGIQQKFSDYKVSYFSSKSKTLELADRLTVLVELNELLVKGEWRDKKAPAGETVSVKSVVHGYRDQPEAGRATLREVFKTDPKTLAKFDIIDGEEEEEELLDT
jgi:hypothetical protein